MYRFSKSSAARLATCHEDLVNIFHNAILDSPLDYGIPQYGGMRTAEEQSQLFIDNKSKCDGFIKKSYHQTGLAVDIYAYVDGKASWDEKHLTLIAGHILGTANRLGYELEWGGNWESFIDMPHFQLVR